MPKNILLFSDGTGNSAAKLARTNVWRLYDAADLSDADRQIGYYDDGVGTSSFKPLAIAGGAFGWGLKRNVLDLYSFLCSNYREGDRIFCFGFSRGAFTARVLAGLIHNEGIVAAKEGEMRGSATTAYRAYREKRFHSALKLEEIGRALRNLFVGDKDYKAAWAQAPKPPIHFLGVWDTVAAYGLPIDELTRALAFVWPLTPTDREPLERVQRICHAVALDDERNTFHPLLFNEAKLPDGNAAAHNIDEERVTQVWFAGMHSNVGGGYPDDALSGVSLVWMMEQAQKQGLLLKSGALDTARTAANPLGKMYDSRQGLGGFYRYFPRKMRLLTNDTFDANRPCVIVRPKIHESVFQRITKGVDAYAPIGLPPRYALVTARGDIVDQPVAAEPPDGKMSVQERVWNLVWWKRIAYFASIVVAALLLLFPFWRPATEACENWACFVAPAIDTVAAALPAFTAPLFDAYRSHPGTFILLLAAYAVFLRIGQNLQNRIFARMRAAFNSPDNLPEPRNWVYRFRTWPPYRSFFWFMKKIGLPVVFGVLALFILAGTASRAGFKIISSAGVVCRPESGSLQFDAHSVCAYTGETVSRGKRYQVTLRAGDLPWSDGSIATGVGGFDSEEMGWLRFFGVWFRRSFSERWFTPMARIGQHGNDEYPLHPVNGSIPDKDTGELVAEFTARRDGPLFLFVNDAVLPVPDSWQWFYRNNRGAGRVTVELLPD